MKSLFSLILVLLMATNTYAVTKVNGAGATFPYPMYSKWFSEYNKNNKDVQFNYQSIGSGGGIRQLIKQTVDFGASDAPMKERDMKKAAWPVKHIPTVLGAVSVAYNLEVNGNLNLDGETLSAIFLGDISKWNDGRIQKLNPAVKLPNTDILVVRRADGSGTTSIFSDYLSTVSTKWESKVGRGKSLKWPVGIGSKGNEGVTATVKQTEGSIGYVELAYALKNNLPTVALKNKAGEFQKPSVQGVSLSAASLKKDAKVTASIVDAAGKGVYPISAFTYILLPVKEETTQLKEVKKFLKWALTKGQNMTEELHYAPLPKSLATKMLEEIK
ncbi:phosphate ABC transporter substrate-binding protein PstS [Halobacteriovorax sp.]|uniref:phosphate ABC transporter substrate-binding protein PstS n=1 Tax=Halobacteriovorax sp. TaxID=2020862 RepID=UPI003561E1FF